jgi:hypothetical protein
MAASAVMSDGPSMLKLTLVHGRDAVVPEKDAAGGVDPAAGVTEARPMAMREHDQVDNCGVASFPASDPPSWWSGR